MTHEICMCGGADVQHHEARPTRTSRSGRLLDLKTGFFRSRSEHALNFTTPQWFQHPDREDCESRKWFLDKDTYMVYTVYTNGK